MKLYFTFNDLVSSFSINVPTIFHNLAQNQNDDYAYVFAEVDAIPFGKPEEGFLKIPKHLMQKMEVESLKGKKCFSVEIPHYGARYKTSVWMEFIDNEEDLKKIFPDADVKRGRVITRVTVNANQIFIKADSNLVQMLVKEKTPSLDLSKHKSKAHTTLDKILEHCVVKQIDVGQQTECEMKTLIENKEPELSGDDEIITSITKVLRYGKVKRGRKRTTAKKI